MILRMGGTLRAPLQSICCLSCSIGSQALASGWGSPEAGSSFIHVAPGPVVILPSEFPAPPPSGSTSLECPLESRTSCGLGEPASCFIFWHFLWSLCLAVMELAGIWSWLECLSWAWMPCSSSSLRVPAICLGCPFPVSRHVSCLPREGVSVSLEPLVPRAWVGSWPQPPTRFPNLPL
jgi:hypothetical protein